MTKPAYNYDRYLGQLPPLTGGEEDGLTRDSKTVKLFTPDSGGTWFLCEYDADDDMAFGLCDLGMPELGYVSITEIREVRGPLGLPVEVDLWWDGTLGDAYKALNLEVPGWL